MGRSLKKRKLKKTRRVKIPKAGTPKKKEKKVMKSWEWWLFGLAIAFALIWLLFLGKSGNITQDVVTSTPTASQAQNANQ